MSAEKNNPKPVISGSCKGLINKTETFEASTVVLSEYSFDPPRGLSHVMLATQRGPSPDYTTKQIRLVFIKDRANTDYPLTPDTYIVRLDFIDYSTPTSPVEYKQLNGVANLTVDESTGVFSGRVNATLDHGEDADYKVLELYVEFVAVPRVSKSRHLRLPPSLAIGGAAA